jgi:hypothetical protein
VHSFGSAYELWLGSWETALSALATAAESRTLSTTEVAAYTAVIAAERELVTEQFTLLLGHSVSRPDVLGRAGVQAAPSLPSTEAA